MSILPGWARTGGNALPPWYGHGGARGPSGTRDNQPALGSRFTSAPQKVSSPARGMSRTMGGNTAGGTSTAPTAPSNPWLEPGANKPVYGEKPDTSLIDRLLSELQQNKSAPVNLAGNIERVNPATREYERSPEMEGLLGELGDWSKTGGFSGADLSNIRARGVSPIRSVYANAQRGLDRGKALQGGYAPGFGAASSRMAREMSEQLASKSTDLEGMIAEMVQRGKSDALGKRGGLLESEEGRRAAFTDANAGGIDSASKFNAGNYNDALGREAALNESSEGRYNDQALQLAKLREQMLSGNKAGQLTERNTSRAGNLDWERLNQQGGTALIDAIMNQYNTGSTRR